MAEVEKTADLQAKAVELIDQLTAGLKAVAPQMADVTLAAIRFQGVMDLIAGVATTVGSAALAYAVFRVWRKFVLAIPNEKRSYGGEEWPIEKFVGSVCAGLVGGLLCAATLINAVGLLSWQMWAAIIDPRLSLALRVINRLM
jgi:hypothetical protein